jgi:hypothetical protein
MSRIFLVQLAGSVRKFNLNRPLGRLFALYFLVNFLFNIEGLKLVCQLGMSKLQDAQTSIIDYASHVRQQ